LSAQAKEFRKRCKQTVSSTIGLLSDSCAFDVNSIPVFRVFVNYQLLPTSC